MATIDNEHLKRFFVMLDNKEEAKAEITADIKESFDAFCSSTGANLKALKKAYALHKELRKDRQKAATVEFEYEAFSSLLLPEDEAGKQERLPI